MPNVSAPPGVVVVSDPEAVDIHSGASLDAVVVLGGERVAAALAEVGPDPTILTALADLDAALRASKGPAADNLDLIATAEALAIRAHFGMVRRSGEPYVVHPLRTAVVLADMSLDAETIAGGILHDVVEDTDVTLEEVETALGPRVAKLVDGVTKLGQIPWAGEPDQLKNREKAQQAESLRKMFLAMVDDIGVVLIKLADRLHNMRTLGAMPPEKQVKIALQTMEIYAPLANRLGIWQIKSELEDLAFRYLNPAEYQQIVSALAEREPDRVAYIERVVADLRAALRENGIEADLSGRGKHIYSIHRKMAQKRRQFDEIYDVVGVRVIVDSKKDCYGALGVIHSMWHPIPGEFDDYIGTPKESMYQSLHTAVIGLDGHSLEIQIRSREMHQVAEYGVAAHWRYKEGGKKDSRLEEKIAWLRQLMDWQKEIADAEEFVESLKSDVFQDMIYVFTPGGEIKELPKGATPIDFAYRIHTDVGHHCVGAKVNDQQVALDSKLENGQVVRILTSKAKFGPSRDWLQADGGYVVTAAAREKIRQWFRRQQRDEMITQGREILDRELRRLSLESKTDDILKHFPAYQKVDDFLAAIGYGAVSPQQIVARVGETRKDEFTFPTNVVAPTAPARVDVMGAGGLLTNLASCCKPVMGDTIIGYTTRGRGITVHRQDCPNLVNIPDTERLVDVGWGNQGGSTFPVAAKVSAWDRVGLLKDVSTLLADEKVNILSVLTTTHDDRTVTLLLTMEVEGVSQLGRLLQKLEGIRDVVEVRRETAAMPGRSRVSA